MRGVRDIEAARRMGFEAYASVEDAIAAAEADLGSAASVTLMQRPRHFIPRVSHA